MKTSQTKETVYLNRVQHVVTSKRSDVKDIAKTLKSRLSNISKRFVQPSSVNNKYVSMGTLSKLSSADWSTTINNSYSNKPTLHNLQLLQRYLTFVSSETDFTIKQDRIEFSLSHQSDLLSPLSTVDHAARLGATLIEMSVHDPMDKIEPPPPSSPKVLVPNGATRRRPGRPPKEERRPQIKKKDTIRCICTSSRQEFGVMVQCDDCCHWLHLECLALDEKALAETFRCPRCFIQIDDDNSLKLLSTVTWRYAARHQSEVLALLDHYDEYPEDEYDEMSSLGMDDSSSILSVDSTDEAHLFDDASDWSLSSSSSSSCSEAGTPTSEYHFGGDDHWFVPPSSANVFLWNNSEPINAACSSSSISLSLTPDVEPSAVCAQELPEFNFWETSF